MAERRSSGGSFGYAALPRMQGGVGGVYRTNQSHGVLKSDQNVQAPAKPGLDALMIRELMGLYNNQGTFRPGTPGHTISRAPERAAAQANFRQSEKDRSKVYGQAVSEVKGRNPGIVGGYDKASADLQANVAARALADNQAAAARDQNVLKAAAAMGLSMAPPTDTRSDEVVAQNQGNYQSIADAWQGFNGGAGQRAVERNNAVADAFTWQGAQQQAALQQLLQKTLAGLVDQYVAGSAGRMVGGTTNAQKLSIAKTLLGQSNRAADQDLALKKWTTPTQTFRTDAKGGISTSISGRQGYLE